MRNPDITRLVAAALGAAVSFWPAPGGAQAPGGAATQTLSIVCQMVDYGRLVEGLAARFGERPVALGATTDGAEAGVATVVFAAADGATWTLVHLWPDGRACVAASGAHWETATPPPAGAES